MTRFFFFPWTLNLKKKSHKSTNKKFWPNDKSNQKKTPALSSSSLQAKGSTRAIKRKHQPSHPHLCKPRVLQEQSKENTSPLFLIFASQGFYKSIQKKTPALSSSSLQAKGSTRAIKRKHQPSLPHLCKPRVLQEQSKENTSPLFLIFASQGFYKSNQKKTPALSSSSLQAKGSTRAIKRKHQPSLPHLCKPRVLSPLRSLSV